MLTAGSGLLKRGLWVCENHDLPREMELCRRLSMPVPLDPTFPAVEARADRAVYEQPNPLGFYGCASWLRPILMNES
jgi:hypothetical protein